MGCAPPGARLYLAEWLPCQVIPAVPVEAEERGAATHDPSGALRGQGDISAKEGGEEDALERLQSTSPAPKCSAGPGSRAATPSKPEWAGVKSEFVEEQVRKQWEKKAEEEDM